MAMKIRFIGCRMLR